jgi:hypothetical protein
MVSGEILAFVLRPLVLSAVMQADKPSADVVHACLAAGGFSLLVPGRVGVNLAGLTMTC